MGGCSQIEGCKRVGNSNLSHNIVGSNAAAPLVHLHSLNVRIPSHWAKVNANAMSISNHTNELLLFSVELQ